MTPATAQSSGEPAHSKDLTGWPVQAYHWYEVGHRRGHFASVWQRSLYNVKGLKAQPWWTPKETGYTELVKVRRPCPLVLG